MKKVMEFKKNTNYSYSDIANFISQESSLMFNGELVDENGKLDKDIKVTIKIKKL